MDTTEWTPLAALLQLTYPRDSFGPENAFAYFEVLKHLDAGYVAVALGELASTSDRLPTAAQIRGLAAHRAYDDHEKAEAVRRRDQERFGRRMTFQEWIDAGAPGYGAGAAAAVAVWRKVGVDPTKLGQTGERP